MGEQERNHQLPTKSQKQSAEAHTTLQHNKPCLNHHPAIPAKRRANSTHYGVIFEPPCRCCKYACVAVRHAQHAREAKSPGRPIPLGTTLTTNAAEQTRLQHRRDDAVIALTPFAVVSTTLQTLCHVYERATHKHTFYYILRVSVHTVPCCTK